MKKKKIQKVKNEDAERDFWADRCSIDYIDWSKAKRVRLSELKPSEKAISLRMPEFLIEDLKFLANQQGVPYQSLLKSLLSEKVREKLAAYKR